MLVGTRSVITPYYTLTPKTPRPQEFHLRRVTSPRYAAVAERGLASASAPAGCSRSHGIDQLSPAITHRDHALLRLWFRPLRTGGARARPPHYHCHFHSPNTSKRVVDGKIPIRPGGMAVASSDLPAPIAIQTSARLGTLRGRVSVSVRPELACPEPAEGSKGARILTLLTEVASLLRDEVP